MALRKSGSKNVIHFIRKLKIHLLKAFNSISLLKAKKMGKITKMNINSAVRFK